MAVSEEDLREETDSAVDHVALDLVLCLVQEDSDQEAQEASDQTGDLGSLEEAQPTTRAVLDLAVISSMLGEEEAVDCLEAATPTTKAVLARSATKSTLDESLSSSQFTNVVDC